jgi:hypothetical protein
LKPSSQAIYRRIIDRFCREHGDQLPNPAAVNGCPRWFSNEFSALKDQTGSMFWGAWGMMLGRGDTEPGGPLGHAKIRVSVERPRQVRGKLGVP